MVHAWSPSIQEAKAGGCGVLGQLGLCSETLSQAKKKERERTFTFYTFPPEIKSQPFKSAQFLLCLPICLSENMGLLTIIIFLYWLLVTFNICFFWVFFIWFETQLWSYSNIYGFTFLSGLFFKSSFRLFY
jgi:hypothetical protein